MSLKPPNPKEVLKNLEEAINQNKQPTHLIYELMTQKTYLGKYFAESFVIYKESWLLLTSPEGRRYIRTHLNEMLDYIEKVAREIK